jgi:uncharacterized protein (TIGR03643 family)
LQVVHNGRDRFLFGFHESCATRRSGWPRIVPEDASEEIVMTKRSFEFLTPADRDRVIQMAWEDRTSFDAIERQFGLSPGDVIHLMRSELKPSSFRLWRERTAGRGTKHVAKRGFEIGRFRCPDQRGN